MSPRAAASKGAVIGGLLLGALAVALPPWLQEGTGARAYAPIFSPPDSHDRSNPVSAFLGLRAPWHLDWSRLLLELVAIAAIAGALWLWARKRGATTAP